MSFACDWALWNWQDMLWVSDWPPGISGMEAEDENRWALNLLLKLESHQLANGYWLPDIPIAAL
jgi:hypothetical protein